MSVGQARKTLENLIDDRKLLSRQLAELRNKAEDEEDEPAAKVLVTPTVFCYCSLKAVLERISPLFFWSAPSTWTLTTFNLCAAVVKAHFCNR